MHILSNKCIVSGTGINTFNISTAPNFGKIVIGGAQKPEVGVNGVILFLFSDQGNFHSALPPAPDVACTELLTQLGILRNSSDSSQVVPSRTHYIRSVSFTGLLPVDDSPTSGFPVSSEGAKSSSVGVAAASMDLLSN
jgi:hypothetical protein